MSFGKLEIIFIILAGVFMIATGVAMLIIWHKRHRKDFTLEALKIGLIGIVAVIVLYVAFKILGFGAVKNAEDATEVVMSMARLLLH